MSENKIPTAEEVLQSNLQFSQDGHPIWTESSVLKAMKEYGNNIREAALKAVYEKGISDIISWSGNPYTGERFDYLDLDKILSCYPKTLIK